MRELLRWSKFTACVTFIALAALFALHVLSRGYEELHSPAVLLAALILFSVGVSIAAIAHASKLDEEDERIRFRRIESAKAKKNRPA